MEKILRSNNKKWLRTYDNNWKISIGQGDNYATGCLLEYRYFKEHYKLIPRYLKKQQELVADPKAMKQITFTGNLKRGEGGAMLFIIEEREETVAGFSKETVKAFWSYFVLI